MISYFIFTLVFISLIQISIYFAGVIGHYKSKKKFGKTINEEIYQKIDKNWKKRLIVIFIVFQIIALIVNNYMIIFIISEGISALALSVLISKKSYDDSLLIHERKKKRET